MNKFGLSECLYIMFFITFVQGFGPAGIKTWTYELKYTETKTSDPDLLTINLNPERISRGDFALTGDATLNFDIVDGDDNTVEMKMFRDTYGNGNWQLQPLGMPPTHIHKALNTFYKKLIMNSLQTCSDLPYFENEFKPPFEKKKYTFNKCKISTDGFPSHLDSGFLKYAIYGKGAVEWEYSVIVEIMPKD